jgi:tetratricopeptide (TPR) repeat protein
VLRGQSAEVLACADRAEALWREAKAGPDTQAAAMNLRGHGHRLARNYHAAIAALREDVELRRIVSPESRGFAVAVSSLAEAERQSGDLDAANRDYSDALRIARAIDDPECVAIYTGNLAGVALDRDDRPGAEALAREALALAEKIGHRELIALGCGILADALARQGRKPEALPHAQRAVEICLSLRSPDLQWAQQILAECEGTSILQPE